MHKTLYKTGFLAYAILIVMATLFYKERTIFMDAAYHLFSILLNNDFAIQHNRFGAVVTEVFPVMGSKLGLSLKTIVILYSTGTMFFYFLCYFICGSVLRQYQYALLVLMFSILFATETFFWPYSELQQGCTMLIVMFAILNTKMQLALKYVLILVLTITLVFIHPLILIPASFLFIYLLLSKQVNAATREIVICFATFIALYFLKSHFSSTPYEAKASADSISGINTLLPQYFDLYSVKKFIADCRGKFIWIPIVFLGTLAYYIVKRKWLLLGLYVVTVCGLITIINLSYHYSEVPSFYIENLYLPVCILLATPAIFEILPMLRNKKVGVALLLLITISGTYRIYHHHTFYKNRLNWLRGFYTENKDEKLIVNQSHTPMGTLIFSWGTPYEFWLLSTLETGKSTSIIVTDNPDGYVYAAEEKKTFITTWGAFPYADLPKQYFRFTDTVSEYRVIK